MIFNCFYYFSLNYLVKTWATYCSTFKTFQQESVVSGQHSSFGWWLQTVQSAAWACQSTSASGKLSCYPVWTETFQPGLTGTEKLLRVCTVLLQGFARLHLLNKQELWELHLTQSEPCQTLLASIQLASTRCSMLLRQATSALYLLALKEEFNNRTEELRPAIYCPLLYGLKGDDKWKKIADVRFLTNRRIKSAKLFLSFF